MYLFRNLCLLNRKAANVHNLSLYSFNQRFVPFINAGNVIPTVVIFNQKRNFHSNYSKKQPKYKKAIILTLCLSSAGILLYYSQRKFFKVYSSGPPKNGEKTEAGSEIPGLPTYTATEVARHDTAEKRIWVSYKSGVYDITTFVSKHPGSAQILMAAGGDLDPFWELYSFHKDSKVYALLEEYRIGNLKFEDRVEINTKDNPYADEPPRHRILKPSAQKPFNAEPPLEILADNFITPSNLFYIRNHLPVPRIDPEMYELEISGISMKKPVFVTLYDLKHKFPKHTITAAIQCAGNRRSELNEVRDVKGLSWGNAAIGNAQWSGAKLVDVLKYYQANIEDQKILHVQFEGLDADITNTPYGASIPAEKCLDPKADVLLAYEMNGKPLSRDHGFPVRLVAPGIVGARNVKWLGKIVLSNEESHSHWQRNDYKSFSPSTTWNDVDFKSAPAIQEAPVNSSICKPLEGDSVKLQNGKLSATGYAWSGGGRKIIRVDVSVDDGATWHTANLTQDNSSLYRCWSWTIWKIDIPVREEIHKKGRVQIICKAVDAAYNVQPDSFQHIWNVRGVLGNAWHRVNVKISK